MQGHDASFDIPETMRTPLVMRDLQQFLLHALLGNQAPVDWYKRWFKLEQQSKMTSINILAIDGIGSEDFANAHLDINSVKSIFPMHLDFVSPFSYNSNLADDLSILPLSHNQRSRLTKHFGSIVNAINQGQAFKGFRSLFNIAEHNTSKDVIDPDKTKLKLLLNLSQMVEENYPLPMEGPMKDKFASYVFSQDEYEEVTEHSPLFSVDCEMCLTTSGSLELTKVRDELKFRKKRSFEKIAL